MTYLQNHAGTITKLNEYDRQLGLCIREVRKARRLSLHAVETATRGEFKASLLGAHERGERAISASRLARLAAFYNVTVLECLPRLTWPSDSIHP